VGRLLSRTRRRPSITAEERHKAASEERFSCGASFPFNDSKKFLLISGTDGDYQAATLGKLFEKRWRYIRRTGGDEDRVVWSVGRPALRPVSDFDPNIVISELG
jgi:hypothetical protein